MDISNNKRFTSLPINSTQEEEKIMFGLRLYEPEEVESNMMDILIDHPAETAVILLSPQNIF